MPPSKDELLKIRYDSEWFDHKELMDAMPEQHMYNHKEQTEALAWYNLKDRPLSVLAVYGSGRSTELSCAHEIANSKMFLRIGLEALPVDVELEEVELRKYMIEPCNGCYSTASALCNAPCLPATERVIGTAIKPISETKPGDVLPEGVVTNNWKTSDDEEILKITMKDGRQIRLTPNHLIQVSEKSHRTTTKVDGKLRYVTKFSKKWVRADQVKEGDFIEFPLGGSFSEDDYPCEFIPLLAGLIWGDGCKVGHGAPCLYYHESNAIRAEEIKRLSPYPFVDMKHSCSTSKTMRKIVWRQGVQKKLEDFGLKKSLPVAERRIPSAIMNASRRDVCKFISGWVSTDGSVSKVRRVLTVSSASYDSLRDLQILLMKLGIKSSVRDNSHLSTLAGFGVKKEYTRTHQLEVSGTSFDDFCRQIKLVCPRKQQNLTAMSNSKIHHTYSFYGSKVKSVVPDGRAAVYDIEVQPSHEFNAEGFMVHNCTCFPFDGMQKLYPKVLKCDVLLIATPVNQSGMSTRMKAFCDRLISLDGGMNAPKPVVKDSKFRAKAIEVSRHGNIEYAQRLFARVAAYFISSKDEENPTDGYPYIQRTAEELKSGMEAYGMIHADPWYAGFAAKWDEDLSYDKMRLSNDAKAHERAKEVVRAAVERAMKVRENPPKPEMGRVNRT